MTVMESYLIKLDKALTNDALFDVTISAWDDWQSGIITEDQFHLIHRMAVKIWKGVRINDSK